MAEEITGFILLSRDEYEAIKPELVHRARSPLNQMLTRLRTGEALQVNKGTWFNTHKVAPLLTPLNKRLQRKYVKFTTKDGIYWVMHREN